MRASWRSHLAFLASPPVNTARRDLLLASFTSLTLFLVLGLAVNLGWPGAAELDGPSAALRGWAAQQLWLEGPLHLVEQGFATRGLTVATLVLAGLLLLRRQVRAAVLVAVVMLATKELTQYFKELFGRDRPAWQDTGFLHHASSYPSGHASGVAALGALAIALAIMASRRPGARRVVVAVVIPVVLLVCADRLLLGRHYPTDLLGGILLGTGLVLLGLALLHPLPVACERDASLPGGAPLDDRELVVSRSA